MNRRARTHEHVAVLLIALLLVAAIVAVLPLDKVVSVDAQRLSNPVLGALLRGVSLFGQAGVQVILTAIAVAILAWRHRSLEAWFLLTVVLSAGTLGTAIKLLVERPRPALLAGSAPIRLLFDRYSFPSGHAVFYTAFFGALAYLLWKRFSGRMRWVGIGVCLALIALVGPSRVFLGAHFPSDVLAGYLIGGICLFAAILLYERRYGW